jgi:hypothetical protein
MAIEEPQFTIEKKAKDYEIRSYGPTLVAETLVEGSFEEAGNKAFRVLADYIFGNNRSQAQIEMTAPVSQQSQSEKIAMTAPVSQVSSRNGFLIQFMMPAKFNMETIPQPNDPRVQLREIPPRRVVVYRYTGSWSESRYREKLLRFKELLEKDGLQVQGEPVWARFNSPFSIWFLRRNEIWFEVKNP